MHLLFPEHGHLLVAAAAPGREPAWRRAAVTCTSLALNRAGDNGASRAGRVRLPKQWQAGRWRPVPDDLATTGVTLRQPGE